MSDAAPFLIGDAMTGGYGSADILHDCTISVEKGQIAVIVGPNGAGKSTAMKAVFGMLPLREGAVRLGGREVTGLTPQDRVAAGMGFVPQTANVFTSLTVRENLEMGAYLRADDFSETMEQVFALFPILAEKAGQPAGELSGGQRQQVAVGRALMTRPSVLMLDEPTASLDIQHQIAVMQQARKAAEEGSGVIVVLHDLNLACAFADRVVLMRDGRIAVDGPPEEVLTSRILSDVYETAITVVPGPDGRPSIYPDNTSAKEHSAHVHRNEPFPRAAGSGGRV